MAKIYGCTVESRLEGIWLTGDKKREDSYPAVAITGSSDLSLRKS
jgi:hypothetical protein